jgi:hypothetical protein
MVAKIFTAITRAGIDGRLPQNEHRFVLLINIIAVIMITFTWSYIPPVLMYVPDNTPLVWTLLLHGVFFLGIILLNHAGHYLASRLYFGISSLVFMVAESLLTGPETRTHLFMMFAPTIPFIYPKGNGCTILP